MLNETSFEQFESAVKSALAHGKKVVAVVRETLGDFITPVAAYNAVRNFHGSALLESVSHDREQGRYSIVATDPYLQFDPRQVEPHKDPLDEFRELLTAHSPEKTHPFFTGGAIGFLAHNAICLQEPSVPRQTAGRGDLDLPELFFQFYQHIFVFDHATQSLCLVRIVNVEAFDQDDKYLKQSYDRALDMLELLERRLVSGKPLVAIAADSFSEIHTGLTVQEETDLESRISKAKEHIAAGDVFQVVLSQRFEARFHPSQSLDFYRLLRRASPSPYLFHVNFGVINPFSMPVALVGASPEVMVRVKDRSMLVRPLAGTRRRGINLTEDETIGEELAADPKEQAEHRMLVDLARNDVGRFCQAGTVKVEGLMRVEPYGNVLHLVTDVRGQLKESVSSLTAALGSLPAGTLSGAPKIRAMQIIAELEPSARGPYGGAVGWLTDNDLDLCIMIRSASLAYGKIYWQAGAGVVADSVAEKEIAEIMAKSESIRNVLRMMQGVIG